MWEALWWGSMLKHVAASRSLHLLHLRAARDQPQRPILIKQLEMSEFFIFFLPHWKQHSASLDHSLQGLFSCEYFRRHLYTRVRSSRHGKKTIPISGPITTNPLCAKKNTKGTKERTLCFRVVHSWAVCLSLSCPLKKCQEALCAGWWRHLVCLFFSPLTRENPFFIIMHLPFQHPLALTCQFKRTSIPLLVAPFPLHCNSAQNSHMCWLESCY